jgi:hypothetical protein
MIEKGLNNDSSLLRGKKSRHYDIMVFNGTVTAVLAVKELTFKIILEALHFLKTKGLKFYIQPLSILSNNPII